jgi:hypothetical protein
MLGMTDDQERVEALDAELREIREAQGAARQVLHRLDTSRESLSSARSWGTYDTWFGGGLFSSWIKHDRIDDADQSMRQVDSALGQLRKELADIGVDGVGEVGIGDLNRTLDVWFDNIFSDAMSQSRIKDAARRVEAVGTSLVRLQGELERRRAAVEQELARRTAETQP